jgi:hypothetical protein
MTTSSASNDTTEGRPATGRGLTGWVLNLPPFRRPRKILGVYGAAGGGLLAEGLAYSALFAGATGLLFSFGLLGYAVPSASDQQRIIDLFTGQLAPLASIARAGLESVAAHAAVF